MQLSKSWSVVCAIVGAVFVTLMVSGAWAAVKPKDQVIHSFGNGGDGAYPFATMIFDSSGNLYATTWEGGTNGHGSVFELTPTSNGWNETVLYSFAGQPTDGGKPSGGVIFDSSGNLYGTTREGGTMTCGGSVCGTVFKLTPGQNGTWTETVIHFFAGGKDGANPYPSLVSDAAGNLYGTTGYGGTGTRCKNGCGTVFKLSPNSNGTWTESVLHAFKAGKDGATPFAALIFDKSGNLFGTTTQGGTYGNGTVFEMSSSSHGWTESVIYSFGSAKDGRKPLAALHLDPATGNLYGTTADGGANGLGTVFQLAPNSGGGWTESVIYSFAAVPDGQTPSAELIPDGAGNLYSTTRRGGSGSNCNGGCGTIFELSPSSNGWTERVVYSFLAFPRDGAVPFGGLVFDGAGNLYGETVFGGAYHPGVAFTIHP